MTPAISADEDDDGLPAHGRTEDEEGRVHSKFRSLNLIKLVYIVNTHLLHIARGPISYAISEVIPKVRFIIP